MARFCNGTERQLLAGSGRSPMTACEPKRVFGGEDHAKIVNAMQKLAERVKCILNSLIVWIRSTLT